MKLFTVCSACDKYLVKDGDIKCGNDECKRVIPKTGKKRQFVLIDIVSKMRRMYAIPNIAQHLSYSVERTSDQFPGDVWDVNSRLKGLSEHDRRTTQYVLTYCSITFYLRMHACRYLCVNITCTISYFHRTCNR